MKNLSKEEDLVNIYYFNRPNLVSTLWSDEDPSQTKRISSVYAAGNYCYALEKNDKTNQFYSWGMGQSCVLGNRDDENEFKPYTVHPKMYEELPVIQVGCGTQHVVVLTTDSIEKRELPTLLPEVFEF